MQQAGNRRQKLGAYIVEFDYHSHRLLPQHSDPWGFGGLQLFGYPFVLWIDIDAENYAASQQW